MRQLLLLLSVFLLATPTGSEESKAGLPGYCAIGGELIAEVDANGRMRPSSTYRNLNCTYSNGQTARVAVCDQHRYQQPPSVYPIIWDSIKRGWASEIVGWSAAKKEQYWKFYEGVTIQSCDE